MRRALVLISVFAAGLLGTGLASATAAAPAPRAGAEIEREVDFSLHSEGFSGALYVNNNDGDVTATLILGKASQIAYYSAPAKITARRVTARFGTLGELDYAYKPKGGGSAECLGASADEDEAEFEGTFTFTGEEEYVHLEIDHTEGTVHLYPVPRQCEQTRRGRRAVRYHPFYSDEGATLHATAGSRRAGRIRAVDLYDGGEKGPHQAGVFAFLAERREGMTVSRGVQMAIRSRDFHWNLEAGTASVRPPAPFTGSAKFTRHGHDGHGTWIGSLGMPILGGEPIELAGSAFRAFIHKGTPQDE